MAEEQKPKTRVEALEEAIAELVERLVALEGKVAQIEKTGGGKVKGLFGDKRERQAIKDTQTGKVYPSKAALGKALATEADSTAADHFAFYKLQAKFPNRFVAATDEEKAKVEKEEEARVEAERKEAQAVLDAEAAKAKVTEEKGKK